VPPLRAFAEHPEDLFTGRSLSSAARGVHNADIMAQLKGARPVASPGRKAGLTEAEAATLFQAVAESPMVRQAGSLAPKVQGICFGKAVAVHLEAIRMGVDKDLIGKAWAVFDEEFSWSHHVATIVPRAGGGYWAIDPLESRPIDASAWVDNWSSSGTTAYVTPASRYGPRMGRKYSNVDLSWEGVSAYFDAMRGWMKDRAQPSATPPEAATPPPGATGDAVAPSAEINVPPLLHQAPARAVMADAQSSPARPQRSTGAPAPPPNDFQQLMSEIETLTSRGRRSILIPELSSAMLMAQTQIHRRNTGSHNYDGLSIMADFLDSATEQLQHFQRTFRDDYVHDRPTDATLIGLARAAARLRAYVATQRQSRPSR
jgi:hypothetical protein